jgi:hypothetical protein
MAELHAVPPSEPERRTWTPERYRKYWGTIVVMIPVVAGFAYFGVLPVIAFVMITLFLLGCVAAATVLRVRQLNRDRKEWP